MLAEHDCTQPLILCQMPCLPREESDWSGNLCITLVDLLSRFQKASQYQLVKLFLISVGAPKAALLFGLYVFEN